MKNKLRKLFVVIVAIVLMISATQNTNATVSQAKNATVSQAKNATVKSKKIYSGNKVVISVTGFDSSKPALKLKIKNNSKKNLSFNAHAYSVNGIMTGNNIYDMRCSVAKKRKANTELEIDSEFLEKNKIKNIQYIDILLWAYDDAESFKAFETKVIRVKTSLYKNSKVTQKGKKLYKKKGITVKYVGKGNGGYKFAVLNNSGKYVSMDVKSITINNYTSSETDFDLMSIYVFNKNKAFFTIKPSDDFLSDNGIKKVKKVEFLLEVSPKDNAFKSWNTDTISAKI